MDKNWQVNPFGARILLRGGKIVFVGRAGRQCMCRVRYLARKKNKSARRFILDGLIKGMEKQDPE